MKELATHLWRFWQLWYSDPSLKVLVVTFMIEPATHLWRFWWKQSWQSDPPLKVLVVTSMIMGDPPSSHLVVPWSRLIKRVAANTAESFCHFVDFALYGFLPLLSCCFVCLFICLILTRLTIVVLLLSKPSTVELMVVHILGGCKAVPWKSKSLPNKTLQK